VIAKKNVTRRASLKAPTGVPGFDELSHGGLPRNRTTLVMGGPGTGKTVFALQTLVGAARKQREPGIFVAFEERVEEIFRYGATFGSREGGATWHVSEPRPMQPYLRSQQW